MWRAAPFNLFLGVVAFARLPTYKYEIRSPGAMIDYVNPIAEY